MPKHRDRYPDLYYRVRKETAISAIKQAITVLLEQESTDSYTKEILTAELRRIQEVQDTRSEYKLYKATVDKVVKPPKKSFVRKVHNQIVHSKAPPISKEAAHAIKINTNRRKSIAQRKYENSDDYSG